MKVKATRARPKIEVSAEVCLAGQRGVGEAVTAVDQAEGHVGEHLARVVARAAPAGGGNGLAKASLRPRSSVGARTPLDEALGNQHLQNSGQP